MNNKEKVFVYLRTHNHSTINEISNELKIDGVIVLSTIDELMGEGYVKRDIPVPLEISDKGSCFYSSTGKEYCAEDIEEKENV